MMPLIEIAQILLGIAFLMYLPGYFIVNIFFKNKTMAEKIFLSIVFSLFIGLSIGIFLGYTTNTKIFGGFQEDTIWIAELSITTLLAIISTGIQIIKKKKKRTSKRRNNKITSKRRVL